MLRLAETRDEISVVSDQIGTPTNSVDLADAILNILPKIKNKTVQVFHYTNKGVCSWFDFAKAIFEIKGIVIKLNPIETSKYPTPGERPSYSVLNKNLIKLTYGIKIPHWRDTLIESFKANN